MADTGGKGANVGGIYYEVALDTAEMIRGQRDVDRELKKTSNSLEGFGARLTAVSAAVGVLVAAIARLKIAELADEMRLLQARVDVAAGSVENGSAAFGRLVDISRRTQTSLAGNIEVFNRLNQSILQMGGTQSDTLQLTELLGKAIKVSGASAVEAKNAMIQFGQALGSGKLQGDELRSLMESTPYLMKQLADGIGVPIGALKKLGEEGKLTADVVANALVKSAAKIDADFKKFPQTIAGAMQVAQDAAALLALEYDKLSGGSIMLIGATKGVGAVLDELAKQFAEANSQANTLSRNEAVEGWANKTKVALSYLVDVADLVQQTFSVLGRNVAYVFETIGANIGGMAAQSVANARKDYAGARAIRQQMKADDEKRRKELDDADAKTLGRAKLAGQAMRDAWASGAGSKVAAPESVQVSRLKSTPDDDAARKLKAKKEAAQAYLQGLVADNSLALERIDAEEKKALADNLRRQAEDKSNHEIYAKAKVEITKKFARERGMVEEQEAQQTAELRISTITDEAERIAAMRDEAFRRADSLERKGIITAEQAERAKVSALIGARASFDDLAERDAQARAARELAITKDESAKIDMIRDEAIRHAKDGYDRGKLSFDEAEAAKTKALMDAEAQRLALRNQRSQTQTATLQIRADTTGNSDDQANLIRARAQAEIDAAEEARQRDLENEQLYADQKVAIRQRMEMQLQELQAATETAQLAMAQSSAGQVLDILKRAGKERTALGKAAFLAERALAVAQIIINTEVAAAKAGSQLGVFGLPLAGLIRATGYASAGMVAGLAVSDAFGGGRQYGGPVSAGSLYRVGEGNRPEMFVGDSGRSYMIPGERGKVIGNSDLRSASGGPAWQVIINNAPPGTTATVNNEARIVEVAVGQAVATVAGQISANNGQVWTAMRGATNVQGRL